MRNFCNWSFRTNKLNTFERDVSETRLIIKDRQDLKIVFLIKVFKDTVNYQKKCGFNIENVILIKFLRRSKILQLLRICRNYVNLNVVR